MYISVYVCKCILSLNSNPSDNILKLRYFFFVAYFLKGLSMQVVRFRFDGQAINENDTPTSLEMEEGDTIEVYQQQTGGAQ